VNSHRILNMFLFPALIAATMLFSSCDCNDDPPNGKTKVKIENGTEFFPMADGDTWYFSSQSGPAVIRTVSGDTTITSRLCKRVLENGTTSEAWSITADSFFVHLIDGDLRPEPPLPIPLDLEEDDPFTYQTTLYFPTYPGSADIDGTITFDGYVSRTVTAGTFTGVLDLHYLPDDYHEYYVRDLGLIDNGDYTLDSAYVGGVWHR